MSRVPNRSSILQSVGFLFALHCFIASPLRTDAAIVVEIIPAIDQEIKDNHIDGTFDEFVVITNPSLQTIAFNGGSTVPLDRRAVMEFNLTPAQLGLQLLSASFVGHVHGTSTPPGFTQLSMDLFGYAGDGQITAADATATTAQIGEFTIAAGLPGHGSHEVPLDASFIASMIAGSNYLGILTRIDVNTGGISIGSRETSVNAQFDTGPPRLRLIFAVPEPRALWSALPMAAVAVAMHRRKQTRRTP